MIRCQYYIQELLWKQENITLFKQMMIVRISGGSSRQNPSQCVCAVGTLALRVFIFQVLRNVCVWFNMLRNVYHVLYEYIRSCENKMTLSSQEMVVSLKFWFSTSTSSEYLLQMVSLLQDCHTLYSFIDLDKRESLSIHIHFLPQLQRKGTHLHLLKAYRVFQFQFKVF